MAEINSTCVHNDYNVALQRTICNYCERKLQSNNYFCNKKCQTYYMNNVSKSCRIQCDYCHSIFKKRTCKVKNSNRCYRYCTKPRASVQCAYCKKELLRTTCDAERCKTNAFFCSFECRKYYKEYFSKKQYNCQNCGKNFSRHKIKEKDNRNKFCSKTCKDNSHNKQILVKCKRCSELFYKERCYIDRSYSNFCSRDCIFAFHGNVSFVENLFSHMLDESGIGLDYIRNSRNILNGRLELDFYFPSIKFAVEINGTQHYEPIYGFDALKKQKDIDYRKRRFCKELGIKLRSVRVGDSRNQITQKRFSRVIYEIKGYANGIQGY